MPFKPPFLGGFDVVELPGAIRTPASLARTSKDGCLLCPAGEKPTSPSPFPSPPSAWRTGLFVFLFLLLRMSSWPQLTHHSFRETWGRKQGLLGWGLCPRALGAFRAGPRKTSGSTAGCVSTSSHSPSLSLEGQRAFYRGHCPVPAAYPKREGFSPSLRPLPSLEVNRSVGKQAGALGVRVTSPLDHVPAGNSQGSKDALSQQHCLGAPYGRRSPRLKEKASSRMETCVVW